MLKDDNHPLKVSAAVPQDNRNASFPRLWDSLTHHQHSISQIRSSRNPRELKKYNEITFNIPLKYMNSPSGNGEAKLLNSGIAAYFSLY